MPASRPVLFEAFPGLAGRLPHHPFVSHPTPVDRVAAPELPEGVLWLKRDERSCPLYGGNKPRKLEFVIGAALAARSRRLVTTGGLGTHHGLATTILGRSVGLATTLVLVRQPVTEAVVRSLHLDAAWGADLVYGGNVPGAVVQTARVLAAATVRRERPLLVGTGGSSSRGNAGFVSAALELAEQVRAGEAPEPAEIWVAVGTGGTLAGLTAGLRLAGLRTRARGVVVTDILAPSPARLARMARRVLRGLRSVDASIPAVEIRQSDFSLVHGQLGAGYGAPTPQALDAVARAAAWGLELETTYTGKCMAALLERARRGGLPKGPILFWNTFNAVDVETSAPTPLDRVQLPAPFSSLLERARGSPAYSGGIPAK